MMGWLVRVTMDSTLSDRLCSLSWRECKSFGSGGCLVEECNPSAP